MIREIRKQARRNVFKRGVLPYLLVVLVIFIFSFVDIFYSSGADEVNIIDEKLGVGILDSKDIDAVQEYIVSRPIFDGASKQFKNEFLSPVARGIATSHPVVLKALSANQSYLERNMGEVVGFIILSIIILGLIKFIVFRPFVVGEYRYIMEARMGRHVKIRRIFAPFGNKKMFRVFKTMTCYNLIVGLWWFTIIGGIIKNYQYYFVPHIVAENPSVTWKEARDLSSAMTKGYKFKLFKLQLSYIYLIILGLLPFVELFLTIPIRINASVEAYFRLRKRPDIDKSLFIERAFDEEPYVNRIKEGEKPEDINPEYLMDDFRIKGSSFDENDKYSIPEFIVLFFLFSFVGWLWEVGIHIYEDHAFVNRGTMYGPWLPIYGAGGAFIIVFLSRFKKSKPKLFILTMVLCGILEYLTSFYLEFFNNARYWDYDDMFGNLNGRVCVAGLIAFAVGGFFGIYILGPLIKNWLEKLGRKKTKILCIVLVTLFVIDFICCRIFGANAGAGVGEKLSLFLNSYFV